MKINFLFSSAFWGILLILLGISALLRSFNINIPFGRIVFGLVIIYIGIAILSGGSIFSVSHNDVLFNDVNIKAGEEIEDEYNIIFGNGVIDLTDIPDDIQGREIEINTIFGSSEVLIDPEKPVKINVSSAFGKASLPDGGTIAFGEYSYMGGDSEGSSALVVEANVVFGSMVIKEK